MWLERFEHRSLPLLPRRAFLRRLTHHGLVASGLVLGSLGIGAAGYHAFGENLTWLDAVLNAAMILTGMGPVDRMTTTAVKLFARLGILEIRSDAKRAAPAPELALTAAE